MNPAKHNSKYLSFLIAILITLTASSVLWFIQPPLITHASAKGDAKDATKSRIKESLQTKPNGRSISTNDIEDPINGQEYSTNDTAGYLFWAGANERTGVLFYVVDDTGHIYKNKTLLIMDDPRYYNRYNDKSSFVNKLSPAVASVSEAVGSDALVSTGVDMQVLTTPEGTGLSSQPVGYQDGWYATQAVDNLLNATTKIPGSQEEVNYWYYYMMLIAGESNANTILDLLLKADSNWTIVAEPISIQYIYTNNYFETDTYDTTFGRDIAAGSPKPAGHNNGDNYAPYIFAGTAKTLASTQVSYGNPPDGGQFTYKLLNKALPWSMCLDHTQTIGGVNGSMTYQSPTVQDASRLSANQIAVPTNGVGIYFIDVSAMSPPIHTYNQVDSPGPPEVPDPNLLTDGHCVIRKLYYTELIKSDGTTELKDFIPYSQSGTTNRIVVDTEPNYTLQGWKTSKDEHSLTTKDEWDVIPADPGWHGRGSTTVILEGDKKFIYVLLKKVELEPIPEEPWDFQIQESQITKRVTFLTGSSKTQELYTHLFNWHSDAPDPVKCIAHGGKGHRIVCDRVWDTEPYDGAPHTHGDWCEENCYKEWDIEPASGIPHTHTEDCYGAPCSNWDWTDNHITLGLKISTADLNSKVVSKHYQVNVKTGTTTFITSSNESTKDIAPVRSGESDHTSPLTQVNLIQVLQPSRVYFFA